MLEDELRRLQGSLSLFDDFSNELDEEFSFDFPSMEPDDYESPMGYLGYGEKTAFEESISIQEVKLLKLGPMGGGPITPEVREERRILFVISGAVSVRYENGEAEFKAGEFIRIPENTPHSIWNVLESETRMMEFILD